MKRIVTAAITAASVVAFTAGGTAVVSAHNNNGNWNNHGWGNHHHDNKRFSDVRIIDYAVMHSERAISLSNVAAEKATNAELKTFAETSVTNETQRVNDLKALRQQIIDAKHDDSNDKNKNQDVSSLYKMDDNHNYKDGGKSYGWGLMSADDLSKSANLDQDYIDVMIKHHTFTLTAGDMIVDKVDNTNLKSLVRDAMNDHGTEIGQLSTWRAAWFPEDVDSNV